MVYYYYIFYQGASHHLKLFHSIGLQLTTVDDPTICSYYK